MTDDTAVTVTIRRRVKLGREAAFEAALRAAHNFHHAGIYFYVQIHCSGQRAGNLARPSAVVLIDPRLLVRARFLGHRHGHQQEKQRCDFGEFIQLSPSDF